MNQPEIHSLMLGDRERINAFSRAIANLVTTEDVVVDVGCGTGILSALAKRAGAKQVIGIEYFSDSVKIAKRLLGTYEDMLVTEGRSFDIDLGSHDPSVMISETIGAIGPEENIVEIFYDFSRRHPGLSKFLPARLSVKAQWLSSEVVRVLMDSFRGPFHDATEFGLGFSDVLPELELNYSNKIHIGDLSNSACILIGEAIVVSEYELGKSPDSSFQVDLEVPTDGAYANALHLFFEAEFPCGTTLSSSVARPMTHWMHSFVPRPSFSALKCLRVSYTPGAGQVTTNWCN